MELIHKILQLDTNLFLYLNELHNDFWDTIMLLITRKETWLPFYLVIIYYFIKNYRIKSVLILVFLALTILASDQLSVLIKELVQRLRPVYNPEIENMVHNVLRKGSKYGFVSSHAANSFAIFIFTSRIFKNRSYWALLFVWAILLSYSRIYAGVHYPVDIICGGILGYALGVLFFKLMMFVENYFLLTRPPKIEKTKLERDQVGTIYLVFMVLAGTAVLVVSILHYYKYL